MQTNTVSRIRNLLLHNSLNLAIFYSGNNSPFTAMTYQSITGHMASSSDKMTDHPVSIRVTSGQHVETPVFHGCLHGILLMHIISCPKWYYFFSQKATRAGGLDVISRHPETSWIIVHLCLRTNGLEASSLLARPDPQWTGEPGIVYTFFLNSIFLVISLHAQA